MTQRPPMKELVSRIAALERELGELRELAHMPADGGVIQAGALLIDRDNRIVTKRGQNIHLSTTEWRLLDVLAAWAPHTVTHLRLLDEVWDRAHGNDTHYLRIYVGYLRAKLEDDPSDPRYIVSEWGTGYRLALHPAIGRAE